jgi:hypothetical protein
MLGVHMIERDRQKNQCYKQSKHTLLDGSESAFWMIRIRTIYISEHGGGASGIVKKKPMRRDFDDFDELNLHQKTYCIC